jgi:hypothetical protein
MPRPTRSAASRAVFRAVLVAAAALLSACDMLGIDSPEKVAAVREADGKAIGGACRHAGRAIEDCYTLNKKADKAAVFAGWREMNDYMRDNKIDPVAPALSGQVANAGAKSADDAEEVASPKPAGKAAVAKPKGKGHES